MSVAPLLELELDGRGNGWTDITADLLGNVNGNRGFSSRDITESVAGPGTFTFRLNNSATNSAQQLGYYSPGNAARRVGFGLGIRARYSLVVGATTFRLSLGAIDAIAPTTGKHSSRDVTVEAVDWIDEASRTRVAELPVQIDKTGNEVFDVIIASLVNPPEATEVGLSPDEYPYVLDNLRDEESTILETIHTLALSELARVWMRSDGTLVWEPRTVRSTVSSDVDTFEDFRLSDVTTQRDDIINKIQITAHPRTTDPDSTTVLYSLEHNLEIGPNSIVALLGPWHDPDNVEVRVGAIDLETVIATTDYLANSQEDGGGTNETANVSITTGLSGNATRFVITNNSGATVWMTKLQQRGCGVYDYDPTVAEAEDIDSQERFGVLPATVDMKYQVNPALALEAAQYIRHLRSEPDNFIASAEFLVGANNEAKLARVLQREISDRIRLTEEVSGISGSFFINSVYFVVDPIGNLTIGWSLDPADRTAYWLLEVVGRSELDQTTVLGFGLIVGHTDVAHTDSHSDSAHSDVAHIDITHVDSHSDAAHADSAHSDVAHADTAHGDSHSDVGHSDTSHSDTSHSDSHSDTSHNDSHSDTTHQDSHTDVAHGDSHSDVHFDEHGDFTNGGHEDFHNDSAVSEHTDSAGSASHTDVSHVDSHTDNAHSDGHSDGSHADSPHSDVAGSSSHTDNAHADTHTDAGHSDAGHADSHSDSAHSDTSFSDVGHGDSHSDTAHGDLN